MSDISTESARHLEEHRLINRTASGLAENINANAAALAAMGLQAGLKNILWLVGDSREQYNLVRLFTATCGTFPATLIGLGVTTGDHPQGNGTLTYYPATDGFTWQAAGDTVGALTPKQPGKFAVPSGTPNYKLILGNRAALVASVTTAYTVNIAGNNSATCEPDSVLGWLLPQVNPLFDDVRNLGLGGMLVSELDYLQSWIISKIAAAPGFVGCTLGTNSAGATSASTPESIPLTLARLQNFYDEILATGSILIIYTESGRFQSGGTTPLTTGMAAVLKAIANFQIGYAQGKVNVLLVDRWNPTVKNTSAVCEPKTASIVLSAGETRDGVHRSCPEGQAAATRGATLINKLPWLSLTSSMPHNKSDLNATPSAGIISGSGGTVNANGANGVAGSGGVPTGFDASNITGSGGGTITVSQAARSDGNPGSAVTLTIAGATLTHEEFQLQLIGNQLSALQALPGYVAGQSYVVLEWEVLAVSGFTNVDYVTPEAQLYGPLGGARVGTALDNKNSQYFYGIGSTMPLGVYRTMPLQIPADISLAFFQFKVGIAAGGGATVTVGNMRYKLVEAPAEL